MLKNFKISGVWKNVGICFLSLVLFLMGSCLLYITKLAAPIPKLPEGEGSGLSGMHTVSDVKEEVGQYWTVAVFGVDSRDDNVGAGPNADAQILCSVNLENGEVKLLSVYRDTYLLLDSGTGRYGKSNQSYHKGGPALAVSSLNTNLDLQIDDYITFSWKSAAEAINLLGGIDVDISASEWPYMNAFITETVNATRIPSTHLEEEVGVIHLDGVQAVAYSRLRLMDSDQMRTERQREVIELVLEKLKAADWSVILEILEQVLPELSTTVTMEDFVRLGAGLQQYRITDTSGFPFAFEEVSMSQNGNCLIPNTLESNVTELHQFLYSDETYQCTGAVREIGQEILKQAIKN